MRGKKYPAPDDRRCRHRYDSGERCAQWTVKRGERCPAHTPEVRQKMSGTTQGIRNGNQNSYKSGWCQKPLKPMSSLNDLIDELFIHHKQLSLAIAEEGEALSLTDLARLVSIQSLSALRILRLMKEQRLIQLYEKDKLLEATLDAISEEFGLEL